MASLELRGGKNIAMKVPAIQFQQVVESLRALGLPIIRESTDCVSFACRPIALHVDRVLQMSQAGFWLEFVTSDLEGAAEKLADCAFERCDGIEHLAGHTGFWVSCPTSIITW